MSNGNALKLDWEGGGGFEIVYGDDKDMVHMQTFEEKDPKVAPKYLHGSYYSESDVRKLRDYLTWWLGQQADKRSCR